MTDNTELCSLTIRELASALAAGEASPVEVTEGYLQRIEALEPELNAYICVAADSAMTAARKAEAEIQRDGATSLLHGVPLAHKDIVDVAGMATTCGSQVLAENFADRHGAVVEKLETAGAICLGKLNMNEFATILPSEHFGPVRNPWSPGHSPGGSSSGSEIGRAHV